MATANAYLGGRQFIPLRSRVYCVLLTCMTLFVLSACMRSEPTDAMDVCIRATKSALKAAQLDVNNLKTKCECVQAKQKGVLPATLAEWDREGKGSAGLSLATCLQPELTAKYEKFFDREAASDLKKKGFTDRRIKAYTVCAGGVWYEALRRRYEMGKQLDTASHNAWQANAYQNCYDAGG